MLSRRQFLMTAAYGGTLLTALPLSATVAPAPTNRRLIVINLRGGVDGLALVPAIGDPNFETLRRGLAPLTDNIVALDDYFGLHEELTPLHAFWRAEQLAVVHAVATAHRGRSHFDAQDELETGLDRPSATAAGWLNRALGYFDETAPRLGLAVGYDKPRILLGPVPVATWAPRRLPAADNQFLGKLLQVSRHDAAIGQALADGMAFAAANEERLGEDARVAGPGGGRKRIRQLARAAGKLLSAEAGGRVAALDIGGWDTHGFQHIALSYRMPYLTDAVLALRDGLGDAWRQSLILVITEFGRTAGPNGTQGTDHGTASAALLIGGAVRGGRVVADWPGLRVDDLHDGRDLRPTTDLRALFKTVLTAHLGLDPAYVDRQVFPDHAALQPLDGLIRV